jgi:phenylacetate-CoA ligase
VIRWVHGYPSLVAEFCHVLEQRGALERRSLQSQLFGVLLGSEFPAPAYRSVIERVLSTNVVSWYGHSEMAVLARETALGVYETLPTYGYAEAVPADTGHQHRLVGTSLHNRVHPLIRYDTGDLIEPISVNGGALSFRITEGRVGEFVSDRSGRRHSLTALIFGRHHPAFDHLRHVQVRDHGEGRVSLVVTPRNPATTSDVLRPLFDLSNVDIAWTVEVVDAPVRTVSGKIRLLIP